MTALTAILIVPAGTLAAAGLHLARIYRQGRDYEAGLYQAAAARAGLTRTQAQAQAADRARALHPRLYRILRYR